MSERRLAERLKVSLKSQWEGALARKHGEIVDISATGCFVLTDDKVHLGELVRIEIELFEGKWVYMWGEVVYQIKEMGFALCFTGSVDDEYNSLLEYIRWGNASNREG